MAEQIEFDPLAQMGPGYFEVMRNQRLGWLEVIGELIDNSFDAAADRVSIRFAHGGTVEVVDNGEGCDNIEQMLSLGVHYVPPGSKNRNRIGRWGVGLNDAATWLWGVTEIYSRSGNTVVKGTINWPVYTSQTNRKLAFDRRPAEDTDDLGTWITFRTKDRRFPDVDALANDIGYFFSPGLQKGKHILLIYRRGNKRTIAAWKLPPFEGATINETFVIHGRAATLIAGVVRDGHPNERKGYSIFYENRIIKNTTTWANGGSSLARFCATVELDSRWTLSKNKTEIKESMLDELEREVYQRCQHLIARAAKQSLNLKNSLLDQQVRQLLQANLDASKQDDGEKEKRDQGKNEGTVKPKHTGRTRHPKKTQPGDRLSKISAIQFDWEEASHGLVGRADFGKHQCMIWLNETHAYLKYLKETENSEAIASICWVIAAEANQRVDGNQLRLIMRGDNVVDCLSRLLSGYDRAVKKTRIA
jgi:hypothetical protein